MSENDPQHSPVTKLVPGFALIALVGMIAAAIFHVVTMRPAPAPQFSRESLPPAPDYVSSQSWMLRPADELPGGWARPWGVDLIWYIDRNEAYAGGWNAPLDWIGSQAAYETDAAWAEAIDSLFGIFVPKIRVAATLAGSEEDRNAAVAIEREDALAAFDHYASYEHKTRGFFIGGRETSAETAVTIYKERIAGTAVLNDLFGGFVFADADISSVMSEDSEISPCSETQPIFPCYLDISKIPDEDVEYAVSGLLNSFSAYLDKNAPKPAEPFPPMETIEIAPINKPDGQ